MTPEEIKRIQKFLSDPDWVLIENMIKNSYDILKYDIPENTAPTEFKARLLANKKLRDAVDKFLSDSQVIKYKEPQKNQFE